MFVVLLVISIVLNLSIIAAGCGWFKFSSNPYLGYLGFLGGAILLVSVNLCMVVLLLLPLMPVLPSCSFPYLLVLGLVNVNLLLYSGWFFFGPPG